MSPLVFLKGQIFCYRMFDIADEIDLEKARTVLTTDVRRLKLSREGSQYLELPNPPLAVELGRRNLTVRGQPVVVDAVARVFDHGAASILLKVPIPAGTELEQLIPIADELYDSRHGAQTSLELLEALRRALEPVTQGRHIWDQSESYTVIFAEQLQGNPTAKEIQDRPEVAQLLLGEVERD